MDTEPDNNSPVMSVANKSSTQTMSQRKISLIAVFFVILIATGVPSPESAVAPERNVHFESNQSIAPDNSRPEIAEIGIEVSLQPPADLIVESLKQCSLWDLPSSGGVPRVLFDRYPDNLCDIDEVPVRKKVFLHTLLPVVLTALDEIDRERAITLAIVNKQKNNIALTSTEQNKLFSNMRKYRAQSVEQLLVRMDKLPISLILAQAAVESSWGVSRFAKHGNNLFGMWTWGERGIIPERREEGKTHKVRIYDSILDSVRSYLLTLNRHNAYEPLRTLRQTSRDPLSLVGGLTAYSARGEAYSEELARVITYNNLRKYDHYRLSAAETARIIPGSSPTAIQ